MGRDVRIIIEELVDEAPAIRNALKQFDEQFHAPAPAASTAAAASAVASFLGIAPLLELIVEYVSEPYWIVSPRDACPAIAQPWDYRDPVTWSVLWLWTPNDKLKERAAAGGADGPDAPAIWNRRWSPDDARPEYDAMLSDAVDIEWPTYMTLEEGDPDNPLYAEYWSTRLAVPRLESAPFETVQRMCHTYRDCLSAGYLKWIAQLKQYKESKKLSGLRMMVYFW